MNGRGIEASRDLQLCLVDQGRNRIEIARFRHEAKSSRFQWDRSTARERIYHCRGAAGRGSFDLGACLPQDLRARVPVGELLNERMESLAFPALASVIRECLRMTAWVINELGEEYRPRGCQRLSRPPQVKRRRVPVPDCLLTRRRSVDRLQWQSHLDQLALVHYFLNPPYANQRASSPLRRHTIQTWTYRRI